MKRGIKRKGKTLRNAVNDGKSVPQFTPYFSSKQNLIENTSINDSNLPDEMQEQAIMTLKDLEPFIGKIVSFSDLDTQYEKENGERHCINDKTFCYITNEMTSFDSRNCGYGFYELYNKYNSRGTLTCIYRDSLTEDRLKRKNLKVSLATEKEIDLIKKALADGGVRFASSDYNLLQILETDPVPERPSIRNSVSASFFFL